MCSGIFFWGGVQSLLAQSESALIPTCTVTPVFVPFIMFLFLLLRGFPPDCQTNAVLRTFRYVVGGSGKAAAASVRRTHPSLTYLMAGFW